MYAFLELLELETAAPDEHDDITAEGGDQIEEVLDRLDALKSDDCKVPYKTSRFTVQVVGGNRFTFIPQDGGFKLAEVSGSEVLKQAFATQQITMPTSDPDVRSALRSLYLTLEAAPRTPHGRTN